MSDDMVKILDGNTFVVSDGRGDIEASLTDPTGLFSSDTRFLSKKARPSGMAVKASPKLWMRSARRATLSVRASCSSGSERSPSGRRG